MNSPPHFQIHPSHALPGSAAAPAKADPTLSVEQVERFERLEAHLHYVERRLQIKDEMLEAVERQHAEAEAKVRAKWGVPQALSAVIVVILSFNLWGQSRILTDFSEQLKSVNHLSKELPRQMEDVQNHVVLSTALGTEIAGITHEALTLVNLGYHELIQEQNPRQSRTYANRALKVLSQFEQNVNWELDRKLGPIRLSQDDPNGKLWMARRQALRTDYQRSLRHPRTAALNLLAQSSLGLGEYDAALSAAERLIEIDPKSVAGHRIKGHVHMIDFSREVDEEARKQAAQRAIAALKKATEEQQEGNKAFINLAEMYFVTGRFQDSKEAAEKYLEYSTRDRDSDGSNNIFKAVALLWRDLSGFLLAPDAGLRTDRFWVEFSRLNEEQRKRFDVQVLEDFLERSRTHRLPYRLDLANSHMQQLLAFGQQLVHSVHGPPSAPIANVAYTEQPRQPQPTQFPQRAVGGVPPETRGVRAVHGQTQTALQYPGY